MVIEQYDFFLWSCGASHGIAERLTNDLERRCDFTVNKSWEQSLLAKTTLKREFNVECFDNEQWLEDVYKAVEGSVWTLVCLKDGDLDFNKVLLTLKAGLKASERCQRECLLLVVTPNMAEQLSASEFMKLKTMPGIKIYQIDFKNDYLSDILQLCWDMLDAKIPGCLAHGLAFSHFVGFWRHILPGSDLQQKMRESDTYKTNPGTTSTKLYVLLPSAKCFQEHYLEGQNNSASDKVVINLLDETLTWKLTHAVKPREYKLQVHAVSKHNQTFYCVVDTPHVLQTIYLMGKHQFNNSSIVDVASEIKRFYHTANLMLNHSPYLKNTVAILYDNEGSQCMEDVLFDALHNELVSATKEQKLQPPERLLSTDGFETKVDAAVMWGPESDKDLSEKLAKELEFLDSKVCRGDMEISKWHVFVVSKEALEDVKQNIAHLCRMSLAGDKMRTILLLRDVHPIDLPSEFQSALTFREDEPGFLQNINSAITGEPVTVEYSLPTGDVASGLAWGYAVQYLNLTLGRTSKSPRDFIDRIETFVHEHDVGEGCVSKLFILCPHSCMTDGVNIVRTEASKSISLMGSLEAYEEDMGDTKGRKYELCVYKYENGKTNKTLCFVCEYCTPFKCLGEMANKYPLAGLQKDAMYKQCERFVELLPKILSDDEVEQKFGDYSQFVELIYFDDHEETILIDVLEKNIVMRKDLYIIRPENVD